MCDQSQDVQLELGCMTVVRRYNQRHDARLDSGWETRVGMYD
jgi:hypothetical protein